ncbi:hypothetical protein AALP_AAs51568U000100 [Arabis alpina]|uniref:Uncharacterized protein n=1 Tax=Arabis alpina TaxID=50452 RepID=A0A087FZ77_ARAAL|nr:hypothetical protein AALP_AAs51568U000100 [Arabis alpina]
MSCVIESLRLRLASPSDRLSPDLISCFSEMIAPVQPIPPLPPEPPDPPDPLTAPSLSSIAFIPNLRRFKPATSLDRLGIRSGKVLVCSRRLMLPSSGCYSLRFGSRVTVHRRRSMVMVGEAFNGKIPPVKSFNITVLVSFVKSRCCCLLGLAHEIYQGHLTSPISTLMKCSTSDVFSVMRILMFSGFSNPVSSELDILSVEIGSKFFGFSNPVIYSCWKSLILPYSISLSMVESPS